MGEERVSTRSTLGPQVLSNRPSSPTLKFGTGGRTTKLYQKSWEAALLGRTSAGPTCAVSSAFGKQPVSRCRTAPAHRVPKADLHSNVSRQPNIGPGAYNVPVNTIGVELLESQRPRSAAYKLGTSQRWCEFKSGLTGEPVQPLLVNTKLPLWGQLGDAPAWTFHGPELRRPMTAGGVLNASYPLAPTSAASPGPGAYTTELSSFGNQVVSHAANSPAIRMPSASRDSLMRQALPRGQEHVLMGRSSPGPCCPQTSSLGKQLVSRSRTASGIKFGSSDRFSDLKPRTPAKRSSSSPSSNSSSNGTTPRTGTDSRQTTKRYSPFGGSSWPDGPGPGQYVV